MSSQREVFIGTVTDNEDEEKRGRILVACAALMGVDDNDDPIEYPEWIPPRFPHVESADGEVADSGFFYVPNVGSTVEFEITVASSYDQIPGQASISNPDPRWIGCLWTPADKLSTDFTTNYPDRMGWRSRRGHLLMFDNTEGDGSVILRHGGENEDGAGTFLAIDQTGSVTIGTEHGQLIYINDADKEITVLDANKNMISMTPEGVNVVEGSKGHMIVMNSDGIFVTAAGNCTVTANDCHLSAGSVQLGANAAEYIIKGMTFQGLFNAHTHLGNMGAPTGPPLVPLVGSELSLVTKTE